MVLRTLEMQGFKSFPDKTVLNFGKGITAVVGPNGSGKSNISDAVRWVLGETSTKSLRGSKMEDVIFGGTSARKALGFAQVQLTLDNSDGTLKDRGEIVTVTRRYYRSGESEYKIDGEQVRRKDIRELFMDTGLGADGYSLVGQGKIDSIISAKNEDRRELFEEAAGISRFRHKRTDAQRRLEQTQENLVLQIGLQYPDLCVLAQRLLLQLLGGQALLLNLHIQLRSTGGGFFNLLLNLCQIRLTNLVRGTGSVNAVLLLPQFICKAVQLLQPNADLQFFLFRTQV